MKIRIVIFFILCIKLTCGYKLYNETSRPLLSFFAGNYQIPACLVSCTFELKNVLTDFAHGNIELDSRDKICSAYEKSLSCVEETDACKKDAGLFEKLSSGLKWACFDPNPLESVLPCIVTMGKQARENKNCAEICQISNSSELNQKSFEEEDSENPRNMITRVQSYCQPLACFMNCTRDQMNSFCPTAGTRLTNVIASAFDELLDEFQHTTDEEKTEIIKNVPESCRVFFDDQKVLAFRFDEQFIYDVFFMIKTRRTKMANMRKAKTDAEKLLLEILDKMHKKPKRIVPLSWTGWKIATASAMASVLLLNFAGLIFTIYWCLTNSEDKSDRTGFENAGSQQFLEPNIRMKLKMPRMRSAAITDSCPDVFELRVPRNGNNQSAQCDEQQQTIVVPRWKRRRTFSVPLEPRQRHDSTNSDQFPNVVIVKSRDN